MNTVFCQKYQQQLPALTRPPFPGEKGQKIMQTVSAKAWQEWLKLQTMLINENQLSLVDVDSRRYLQTQMEKFFNNEDFDKAVGYVPPSEN